MARRIYRLLVASAMIAACSHSNSASHAGIPFKEVTIQEKEQVPENFLPRPLRIVAAGDSLTQGVGDSTESGGYLPYLENLLLKKGIREISVENFGVKGHRTDQLLRKLGEDEVRSAVENADLVTVTIGGNDMMKIIRQNIFDLEMELFEEEKEAYASRIAGIMERVHSINPEAAVVLIGFYNPFFSWFSDIAEMNQVVEDWNRMSREVVERYENGIFVEIDEIFLDLNQNLLFEDYFHPNDQGYELISEEVFEQVDGEKHEDLIKRTYTSSEGMGEQE